MKKTLSIFVVSLRIISPFCIFSDTIFNQGHEENNTIMYNNLIQGISHSYCTILMGILILIMLK